MAATKKKTSPKKKVTATAKKPPSAKKTSSASAGKAKKPAVVKKPSVKSKTAASKTSTKKPAPKKAAAKKESRKTAPSKPLPKKELKGNTPVKKAIKPPAAKAAAQPKPKKTAVDLVKKVATVTHIIQDKITQKIQKKTTIETSKAAVKKQPFSVHPKKVKQAMTTVARPSVKTDRITTGMERDTMENIMLGTPMGENFIASSHIMGIPPYQAAPGEAYMNETQRRHFRDILNRWRTQLMEAVDQTMSHMKDEAANFPDPNDRATQEEEFSLELRTRDRERKLIKKIDEALEKLKHDDYGFCEACGIEIGIRRLEARPTATLCIDCKTVYEIRERQTG
ncbi:MAG: polymerase-binding transcription factor DksA [Gammaproteobacteria bacterium]|jgi:DnaK suppressor protein|nr:polymerase-binding transcription factor DksA [Gammaproteobacteria bacterium]